MEGLLKHSFPFYPKRPIDMAKATYILGLVALEGPKLRGKAKLSLDNKRGLAPAKETYLVDK